jgi:hypothetical protein
VKKAILSALVFTSMALEAMTLEGNNNEIPVTSTLKKTTLIIINLMYFIIPI